MKKLAVICWLLAAGMAQAELAESSPDVCAPLRVQNEASVSLADQPSTTVDILVAFDRNAAAYAKQHGGGVFNFANVAVTKMNTVLANNGIDACFRFRRRAGHSESAPYRPPPGRAAGADPAAQEKMQEHVTN